MRLIYRQMIGYLVVIATIMIMLTITFISVTNSTIYRSTWMQLSKYADSIVSTSVRYDTSQQKVVGFNNDPLRYNGELLSMQNVHFVIYGSNKKKVFSSNEFQLKITASDWKKLQDGDTIHRRIDHPSIKKEAKKKPNDTISSKDKDTKKSDKSGKKISPPMTEIIRPYFYKNKLVAVVAIGTYVSTVHQSINQLILNFIGAFIIAMILAIGLSYLIARSLTNRIKKIQLATHQIAQGDHDIHLNPKGKDELDQLSEDFNFMVDSLAAQKEEIHQQEERRKQFMANAAHEMRTPLTTINGLLEGLAYDAIPEEDRMQSIKLMQNDTKRLIRLVNDNLDYEKIRTNQISMDRKIFDASAVLETLHKQLSKKAEANQDRIEIYAPKAMDVYADYDRFVQIMFNIIQNAIQFTQNGVITISGQLVANGSEFSVSDTGIGMSEDQIKHIWDRYYKADPSRMSTKYGESGLGMAIVHQLVELHGGKITVKSKPNQGSTFTVFFPDRQHAPQYSPKRSKKPEE